MKMHYRAAACALIGLLTITSLPVLPGAPIAQVAAAGINLVWVDAPTSVMAGAANSITLKAVDDSGNLVTNYTNAVTFPSSDPAFNISPLDLGRNYYTFKTADGGQKTFTVKFNTAGSQTATATDTSVSTRTAPLSPTVGDTHLVWVDAPTSVMAGAANSITLKAVDDSGNLVTNYTNAVTFPSSDPAFNISPLDLGRNYYTFKTADGGQKTFTVKFNTAGSQTATATDTSVSTRTAPLSPTVGDTHLVWVDAPTSVMAGAANSITLKAVDDSGNLVTNYTNAVTFPSSDPAFNISPLDLGRNYYTFKTADGGQKTFTVKFNTAGSQTATATDTSVSTRTAPLSPTVGDTHLVWVDAPTSVMAGAANSITLKAVDDSGNLVTNYTNAVTFPSSDPAFNISPLDLGRNYYTFKTADGGQKTFTVKFNTAGSQTATATDTSVSTRTAPLSPTVGDTHLVWVDAPTSVMAGAANSITLKAVDDSGNLVTNYTNAVTFPSSDPAFNISPLDLGRNYYTFKTADGGQKTFTVKFNTAGSQTATATDTSVSTRTAAFTAAVHIVSFVWTPSTSSPAVGQALQANLSIVDESGNPIAFAGQVKFTSSDPAFSISPLDLGRNYYTFTSGDNGQKTFTIRFATAGSQTLVATDNALPTRTATLSATVGQIYLQLLMPASTDAGAPVTATVRAVDGLGNLVPYTGGVRFTSSDSHFSISPLDLGRDYYTFTTADGGQHDFTLFLRSSGTQTLTARETAATSRNAVASATVSPVHLAIATDYTTTNTGDTLGFTIRALRGDGSLATTFGDTVHFTSSDPGFHVSGADVNGNYTFTPGDFGMRQLGAVFASSGNRTINAVWNGQTVTATVAVSSTHLEIAIPANAQSGVPTTVVVSARDSSGNLVTAFHDALRATSTDAQADLSAIEGYNFVPADNGTHTFSVVLRAPGSRTITVRDASNSSRTTTSSAITVADTILSIGAPATANAGGEVNITVAARTSGGQLVSGYRETLTVASNDPLLAGADCHGFTFTSADAGSHVMACRFETAGSRTLTVTNPQRTAQSATSGSVGVSETYLRLALDPPSPAANQPATLTVTAVDGTGQIVTNFADQVMLRSSEPGFSATPSDLLFLPANAGVMTATVTFATDVPAWIEAIDSSNLARSGRISNRAVGGMVVGMPASSSVGVPVAVEVQVFGTDGSPDPSFTGSVSLTASDGHAGLPAAYVFTGADAGRHVFYVTFNTPGAQTATASGGALSGTSGSIAIAPVHFLVTPDATSVQAGALSGVTVTILDELGSPVVGYANAISLNGSDAAAVIGIPSYKFVPGTDAGSHHLDIIWETAGPAIVTVADPAAQLSVDAPVTVLETHLVVTLSIASTDAGVPITATVSALDESGAPVTAFAGSVELTSSGGGFQVVDDFMDRAISSTYSFVAADAGSHPFRVRLSVAGDQSVVATDTRMPTRTGAASVSVAQVYLHATLPDTGWVTADSELLVSVRNAAGGQVTGYRGLLTVTCSAPRCVVTGATQISEGSGGQASFAVRFGDPGTHTVTVTDADDASRTVTLTQTVAEGELRLVVPAITYTESTTTVTVLAVDMDGQPVVNFGHDELTATTTDSTAIWPAGSTYSGPGTGTTGHAFKLLFGTPGTYTVTVTDELGHTAHSGQITVVRAVFEASAPATVYAGVPFNVDLSPRTESGAAVPAFAATLTLTSSDPLVRWMTSGGSASYSFKGCDCGPDEYVVALKTLGRQTITMTSARGVTRTVAVDVVAPPGGTVKSGRPAGIDIFTWVQWTGCGSMDIYVKSSVSWRLLAVTDLFGPMIVAGAVAGDGPMNDPGIVEMTVPGATTAEGFYLAGYAIHPGFHQFWLETEDGVYFLDIGAATGVAHFSDFSEAVQATFRPVEANPGEPIADWSVAGTGVTIETDRPLLLTQFRFDFGPGNWNYPSTTPSVVVPAGASSFTVEYPDPHTGYACYVVNAPFTSLGFTYMDATGHTGVQVKLMTSHLPWFFPNPVDCSLPSGLGSPFDFLFNLVVGPVERIPGIIERLPDTVNEVLKADPVDSLLGSWRQDELDIALGGLNPSLTLERTYQSAVGQEVGLGKIDAGLFGPGWTSTLEWRISKFASGDGTEEIVQDGTGQRLRFTSQAGAFVPGAGVRGTLTVAGSTTLYNDSSGRTYSFNSTGRLTKVTDKSGLEQTIHYGSNGLPDVVTDPAGRTLHLTSSNGTITRATLDDGRYAQYTYATGPSGHRVLANVRALDGAVTAYTHDSLDRITAVHDGGGELLLTNKYDEQGRIATQTDPLGHVTSFSYSWPGTTSNGSLGLATVVTGPDGAQTVDCFDLSGNLLDEFDALGGHKSWTYDKNGMPTSATDAIGRTSKLTFSKDGRLLSEKDPRGRSTAYTFDSNRRLTQINSSGRSMAIAYDGAGNVVSATTSKGSDSMTLGQYAYTANGQLATSTMPGDLASATTYDSRGYITSITDPDGNKTTYVTDDRGFVTEIVDPLGNVTGADPAAHRATFTYDDLGRILTVTNQLGRTVTYTYDALGNVKTATSPMGFVTTNQYDDLGRITSTTQQINATTTTTTTFGYDVAGNLAFVRDGENRTTTFAYDAIGRQVRMTDPAGGQWRTAYDAVGRVTSTTDPTSRTTHYEYDLDDHLVKAIDSAGNASTNTYGLDGLLQSSGDALGNTTTYGYDWLGRVTGTTNALGQQSQVTYDAAGRVASIEDPAGKTTHYEYDADGLLTVVIDAASGHTNYTYDAAGNLVNAENARGKSRGYEYDSIGRQTAVIDELGRRFETSYDLNGRIESTTDAKLQATSFTYDDLGRVLTVAPASGSPISFSYDKTGLVQSMNDANGQTAYDYDNAGRLTSTTRNGRTTSYTYDLAGRTTSVVYPGEAGTVQYGYDTAGRLQTLQDWAGRTTSFTYDADNRLTQVAGPTVAKSIGYDALSRVASLGYTAGENPLLTLGYTYDLSGNLATSTDDQGTSTYTYDALNRLTTASYADGQNYSYTYDAVGNILTTTTPGGTTTHTYDDANQISDSGYVYDANGSLVSDGSRTFTYDALNRLVGVAANGVAETYAHDGQGNRWATTTGGQTKTVDLDVRGLATVLMSGDTKYLPGAPNMGSDQNGTWVTNLTDFEGSVVRTVDSSGSMGAAVRYDPYGGLRSGSTSQKFGYTGEWTDASSLVYLRARAYDPSLGRFLSADTWGGTPTDPLTANAYAYALDNPFAYTDPSGHLPRAIQYYADSFSNSLNAVRTDLSSGNYEQFAVDLGRLALAVNPLTIPGYWGANFLSRAFFGQDIFSGQAISKSDQIAAQRAFGDLLDLTMVVMMFAGPLKGAASFGRSLLRGEAKELEATALGSEARVLDAEARDLAGHWTSSPPRGVSGMPYQGFVSGHAWDPATKRIDEFFFGGRYWDDYRGGRTVIDAKDWAPFTPGRSWVPDKLQRDLAWARAHNVTIEYRVPYEQTMENLNLQISKIHGAGDWLRVVHTPWP